MPVMNFNRLVLILTVLSITLSLGSCDRYRRQLEERHAKAEKSDDSTIKVGIVWPANLKAGLFREGIEMALNDINRENVLPRPMELVWYDETMDLETSRKVAKRVAANTDLSAVIGHLDSRRAISAAIIYNNSGIVFISPLASSPYLTNYGFGYVFRNIPSDKEIARRLAEFAGHKGYTRIAILYHRDTYGISFSGLFYEQVRNRGIEVPFYKQYVFDTKDFRPLLAELDMVPIDAIFIADSVPSAAEVIRQYHLMGGENIFLGGKNLDSELLWDVADKAANGTVIATTFSPEYQGEATQRFVHDFRAWYGKEPDFVAAQAYDSLRILAHAFAESGTTAPIVVSTTLKLIKNWDGVSGDYSMSPSGDIVNKSIWFKEMRNGKYHILEE